ncbi:MAG: flippase-like domain-containing protein [Hyphomicrobiales bacterium]|nr:flippase-like domain-containing protein [Hyphomicrobiales bacterium]
MLKPGKSTTFLFLALGGAVLALVAARVDLGAAAAAAASVGWGLAAIALFRLLPIGFDAAGWRALIPGRVPPNLHWIWLLRWIGESVNTLLPVAQVGGDVVRARLLRRPGKSGAPAAASVVADFTVGLAAQAAFALFVTLLLAVQVGGGTELAGTGFALAGAAVLFGLFYLAQRRGLIAGAARLLSRAVGARAAGFAASAREVDGAVRDLYGDRARVGACAAWRLAGWFVRAGEVLLIAHYLDLPMGIAGALVIEGMTHAVRSAAFLLPGALGAQEAGVVAVCVLLGLPAEAGLALALVKRLRELAVGLPGLLAWMVVERRRAGAAALAPTGGKGA